MLLRPPYSVLLGGARPFQISDLFASGTYAGFDGSNLDKSYVVGPGSLALQWQQSASSSPVTASGQTVGMLLDPSQGLALGAQLVANGGMDADASWTKGTGWGISGGKAAHADNSAADLSQSNIYTVGDVIFGEIDIDAIGAGSRVDFYMSNGGAPTSVQFSTTGSKRLVGRVNTGADRVIYIAGGFGSTPNRTCTVDNVSAKKILGNHAWQHTGGSRGLYTETGNGRMIVGDGGDDGYFAGLVPGPEMTMFAAVTPASGSTGTDIVIGANASGPADRCQLGIANGVVAGGWGAHSVSTIVDPLGTDIRNINSVLVLRADANLVELGRMAADGSFSWLYQQPPSGSATTANALAFLATNNAGTLGSFFQGGATFLPVKRKVPDAMILPTMRKMATKAFG